LRAALHDPLTRKRFRTSYQHFSRTRTLTFARVAVLILRGHKLALQNALNKVFQTLGELFQVPTASALSQARQKLDADLFVHLNEMVCRDFYQLYEADGLVQRCHNHRLVACDGTYLTLPDNEQTRKAFSLQTNPYAQGQCVQALCCVLYDLKNDLSLGVALGKRQGEKKLLFESLWSATEEGDLVVLDRHYADYAILAKAKAEKRELIVRLPRQRFKAAEAFWQSDEPEQEITIQVPQSAREFVEKEHLASQLRVRLVRVILEDGTLEVLATTLLDKQRYGLEEFKQVYFRRWREEVFFDRIKNIFEVEGFSATSVEGIKQDIYGVIFLASLESVLSKPEAQRLKQESAKNGNQSQAQVNRAIRYVAMVDRVVELLMGKREIEEVLKELHHLFGTNPTRVRPGRRVERRKGLRYAYRLRFHKYVKKLTL
jgi:hypothetical protein